tara:strand:+ start:9498 stop:10055 length:558 start_codon:yes stop_codon:yes gene_type:complete
VYQITNTVNGKIYIGAHAGDPLDSYMGSGNKIKRAISKYGRAAFQKTILHTCATPQEMFSVEAELVDEAFVQRPDTYNLAVGGTGFAPGHQIRLGMKHTEETKAKMRRQRTPEARQRMSLAAKSHIGEQNNFFGKKHTQDAKEKMSAAAKGHKRCVGRQYSLETRIKMSESAKRRGSNRRPKGAE